MSKVRDNMHDALLSYNFHLDGFISYRLLSGWLMTASGEGVVREIELRKAGKVLGRTTSGYSIDNCVLKGRFYITLPSHEIPDGNHDIELFLPEERLSLGTFHFAISADESMKFLAEYPFLAIEAQTGVPHPYGRQPASHITLSSMAKTDAPDNNTSPIDANELLDAGKAEEAYAVFRKLEKSQQDDAAKSLGIMRSLAAMGREWEAQEYFDGLPNDIRKNAWVREEKRRLASLEKRKSIRTIAFYLPQFHPIPENDLWWGRGFTEWVNVSRSRPLFEGHVQPRIPAELGYYDLRLTEIANRQFQLAREYGIDGFCYYYYWFNGRKLLEKPLDDLVNGKSGPFPFCICWANENWTRRWDGGDEEILISQVHTPESDAAFIRDVAPLLAHKDYIRHNGRPLLIVYRAFKMADPVATTMQWRDYCRKQGIGEICLAMMHVFGRFDDPAKYGFDAAIEFPPRCNTSRYSWQYFFSPAKAANAPSCAYDYTHFCKGHMKQGPMPFPVFRGTTLAWDNSARRKLDGLIFHDYMAPMHQKWLWEVAGRMMREHGEGLVFINAWNEWGEGATLEPDTHWGYASLASVKKFKDSGIYAYFDTYWQQGQPLPVEPVPREHIALICEKTNEDETLALARALKLSHEHDLTLIFAHPGNLEPAKFERLGEVWTLNRSRGDRASQLKKLVFQLKAKGCEKAISLGKSVGDYVGFLGSNGFQILSLLDSDEIDSVNAGEIARWASIILFPDQFAEIQFSLQAWPFLDKTGYSRNPTLGGKKNRQGKIERKIIQSKYAITEDGIIIAVGGKQTSVPVLLLLAKSLKDSNPDQEIYWFWTGEGIPQQFLDVACDSLSIPRICNIEDSDKPAILAGADFYVSCDASDATVTANCLSQPSAPGGHIIHISPPHEHISSGEDGNMAHRERTSALSEATRNALRMYGFFPRGEQLVPGCHPAQTWQKYALQLLLALQRKDLHPLQDPLADHSVSGGNHEVSVILYNHNWGRYLELCLQTIFDQTVAPSEIILIDDGSADISVEVINRLKEQAPVPIKLIFNESHSGNPAEQIQRGIEMARGDFIWPVRACDYRERNFLEVMMSYFTSESTSLAYSESVLVNRSGRLTVASDRYGEFPADDWNYIEPGLNILRNGWLEEYKFPCMSSFVFRKSLIDSRIMSSYPLNWHITIMIELAIYGNVGRYKEKINYCRELPNLYHAESMKEKMKIIQDSSTRNQYYLRGIHSFSVFRWLEKEYHGDLEEMDSQWLANDPDLGAEYIRMLISLQPLAEFHSMERTGRVLFLAPDSSQAAEARAVFEYVQILCPQAIYREIDGSSSDIIDIHGKDGNIPFAKIWCFGLDAALAFAQRCDRAENVTFVCDNSYSRKDMRDRMSPDEFIRLLECFKSAAIIYYLGETIPGIAASLLTGSRRAAYSLKFKDAQTLFAAVKNRTTNIPRTQHAYSSGVLLLVNNFFRRCEGMK